MAGSEAVEGPVLTLGSKVTPWGSVHTHSPPRLVQRQVSWALVLSVIHE